MIPGAVVLAQYAATLDFSETSRLDARATQPRPLAPNLPLREIALASDVSFAPLVRLRVHDRRWDWTLTYTPTLTESDIELGTPPVVLQTGSASVAWHDRLVRVVVSESASYGWENLGYLYGTPIAGQPVAAGQPQTPGGTTGQPAGPTPGQPPGQTPTSVGQNGTSQVRPLESFPYASSNTSAGISVRTSRSMTVSVTGGYSLTGALSNNSQANVVYPEQFGPLASATVNYAASRVDSFITSASAQETTTPLGTCVPATTTGFCRQDVPVLVLQETARHLLSATAAVGASLGLSASIYQLNSGKAWGILPVGGVNFTQRLGPVSRDPRDTLGSSSLRLSADMGTSINVFTGAPSSRIQLDAMLASRLSPLLALSFAAGALQTVPLPRPDPSPLTVLSGGVDLKVRVTRLITVSVGIQGFWQTQQNVGVLPATTTSVPTTTSTEVGYVALSARLPTLRL